MGRLSHPSRRWSASLAVLAAVLAAAATSACTSDSPAGETATEPAPSVAASVSETVAPTTSPSPAPTPGPTPTPTSVLPQDFDAQRALDHTLALVEIGTRLPGTASGQQTRDYIAGAFAAAGWDVEEDVFELPQGGTSANVVASRGGGGIDGSPHLLIGAHWDTVPGTVGANDNATGVGVVLALAEALTEDPATLALPVVLVGFGAEEYQGETGVHHGGSEHMAETASGVVAMLSIDMVGNGQTTRVVTLEGADASMHDVLTAVAAEVGIADVTTDVRGDISDHGAFAKRGIPAAFLWTGPDGRLHTPEDTAEHLDLDDLARAGSLTLSWVRSPEPYPAASDEPSTASDTDSSDQ